MNKKAYLRTLEVVFAVLLTMSVLIYVFSRGNVGSDDVFSNIHVLENLEFNEDFRSCVNSDNITCVSTMVNSSLPLAYRNSFVVSITDDMNFIPENMPDKRVYADSVFIAGSVENYSPRIVKLFYW